MPKEAGELVAIAHAAARRDLIGLFCLALGVVVLWTLSQIVLLIFAAVVLAVAINALAEEARKLTGVGRKLALSAVLLLMALTLAGFIFIGAIISGDIGQVGETIARGITRLRAAASETPWLQNLIDQVRGSAGDVVSDGIAPRALGFLRSVAGGLISVFVVLSGAIYFAASAGYYRSGALALVPRSHRAKADAFLGTAYDTLKKWLVCQLILMGSIGLLVGLTLWFLGVPSALELGLLAGIVEFIPFFGPLIAGAAAVLVSLSVSLDLAGWTLLAFVVIQQVENQVLAPLVQQSTASLPAVVGIFGIIAFGVLFGLLGVVVAAPLVLLILTAVRVFYIGEPAELGEN